MPLSITEYIDYFEEKSTKISYLRSCKRYLEIVTGQPVCMSDLDSAWETYLATADVAQDLCRFPVLCRSPSKRGRSMAPNTISNYLRPVSRYLEDIAEIKLTPKQLRLQKIAMPKRRIVVTEAELTRPLIRDILSHCNERMKLAILLALTAGLRIGEITRLRERDVKLDLFPAEIHIPSEISKNDVARVTFMSPECVDAWKAYMRVRDADISSGSGRGQIGEITRIREEYIIPFSKQTLSQQLVRNLTKSSIATFDERTGWSQIHFHLFRKWFITQAKLSGATSGAVEDMAGHEGYLDKSYRRLTLDEKREEYKKALTRLMIYTPDDYLELKGEYTQRIAELETANAHNIATITELVRKVEEMELERKQELKLSDTGKGVA